jgi:endoglycosylceramidase
MELIFSRINETSVRMNVPVIIGEWGAYSGNSGALASSAQFINNLFEKFGFGNTYWAYYTAIEKDKYFSEALVRPYPLFIAGVLKEYGYNNESGRFMCSWEESQSVKEPTVIYVPDLEQIEKESLTLTPENKTCLIHMINNSKAGYLIIPVTGESLNRTIQFKLKEQV